MTPSVWIVSVNFNGTEDTRKCLGSLVAVSDSAHVVIVDNGSEPDPCLALQAEFPWAHIIRNSTNLGWSGGNNTGIRFALDRAADYILLINNDTVVSPDIVKRLVSAFAGYPQFGVIGPVIHYMDDPDVVMTDGVVFNPPGFLGFFERRQVREQISNPPAVMETDIVNGCCMMLRAEALRRVGVVDDRFFLIHEEADLCLRIKRAGLSCGILAEPLIWHKGSATFKRTGKNWQRYYDTRNMALLLRKHWGFNGRGLFSTYIMYIRWVYYGYCHEREEGAVEAADAVLEGLVDAATLRSGRYSDRRRLTLPPLRWLMEVARRARHFSRSFARR